MNTIYNEDCRIGLDRIPDGSVDLVIMDPPYKLGRHGGGSFGPANRSYRQEIEPLSDGIDDELLSKIVSKLKAVNMYVWCNKAQLPFYLGYFSDRGCNFDLLTWHKSNPTPACNNKYLSDTEYIIYARDPGVKLYGSYETKRKWYVSPYNKADKDMWHHPTIKPLDITVNMVENSTWGGGSLVLDPFMGSGTTAVACIRTGRRYVGFEIDRTYWETSQRRIASETAPAPCTIDSFAQEGAS